MGRALVLHGPIMSIRVQLACRLRAAHGGEHVAQLVEDKEVQLGEVGLQTQEAPFVSVLNEDGDQFSGADEADRVALSARLGGEAVDQVALASPRVPDQEDVLVLVAVLAAHELGDEHLVTEGRAAKSKVSSALIVGKRAVIIGLNWDKIREAVKNAGEDGTQEGWLFEMSA